MNEEKKAVKKNSNSNTTKKKTNVNKKNTNKTTGVKKNNNYKKNGQRKKQNSANKNTVKKEVKKEVVKKEEVVKNPEVVETKVVEEVKKEPVVEQINVNKEIKEDVPVNSYVSIISIVVMAFLILVLFASMYSDELFNKYSSSWDGKSYLVSKSNVHQIKCDEISSAVTGEHSFILVTNAVGEEEFNLEKKLAKVINDYNIKNDFYVYVLNDDCGPIESGSSIASVNLQLTNGLGKVPAILYYRNGHYMDKVVREDKKMINDGDFVHLLDMYEVK